MVRVSRLILFFKIVFIQCFPLPHNRGMPLGWSLALAPLIIIAFGFVFHLVWKSRGMPFKMVRTEGHFGWLCILIGFSFLFSTSREASSRRTFGTRTSTGN